MGCPTKKEYEEAMNNVVFLKNSIALENKRREKIIKELCVSQSTLENYKALLEKQKEVVDKYQIYQELSSHYE